MDKDDNTREDLTLPKEECHQDFVKRFMRDYDDEKDLVATVTKCIGKEMVLDYKIDLTDV